MDEQSGKKCGFVETIQDSFPKIALFVKNDDGLRKNIDFQTQSRQNKTVVQMESRLRQNDTFPSKSFLETIELGKGIGGKRYDII